MRTLIRWFVLGMALLSVPLTHASHGPVTGIAAGVRPILQTQFESAARVAVGEREALTERLRLFYQKRDYAPAWIGAEGLAGDAEHLIEVLRRAGDQGLVPEDYHLGPIVSRLPETAPASLAELEVLLTDGFLRYCVDVRSGRADPRQADPEWFVVADRIDHLEALEEALAAHDLDRALGSLSPRAPAYERLRGALQRYRRIAATGGWAALPPSPVLKLDVTHPVVSDLRHRLRATGDFGAPGGGELFDAALAAAVAGFQRRHGLDPDGMVGPRTRAALDLPVADRIRQLLWNLERWRWMPRDLPGRYLLVNMAGFELQAIEEEQPVLYMRVIVGREYRQTPAFSEPIRYLVLNPYWNVPPSIAVRDLLPKVRKDPNFLAREGFRVFSDWNVGARELAPSSIDWETVGHRSFPYKLRQDPGPNNALGRIKFMLPNQFNVYLHDTPHRELFDKTVRAFSSGCIRLAEPEVLAEYVLRAAPGWDAVSIHAGIETGARRVVSLPEPVPVFLVYWTAWADPDGTVQFRDDVYGRDRSLGDALARQRDGGRTPPH
ncbi:MAG: L,D-transpeptidase family protein [Deferrisomatales bacterium]|nr:L,D-transpeptidase family protein [Deferrisomatales bacterium]